MKQPPRIWRVVCEKCAGAARIVWNTVQKRARSLLPHFPNILSHALGALRSVPKTTQTLSLRHSFRAFPRGCHLLYPCFPLPLHLPKELRPRRLTRTLLHLRCPPRISILFISQYSARLAVRTRPIDVTKAERASNAASSRFAGGGGRGGCRLRFEG